VKKLFLLIFVFILISGCTAKPEIKIFDNEPDDESAVAFKIIGKGGEIILEVWVEYQENLSVAELSEKICRAKEIPFVTSGIGAMRYVKGINNLFEFDEGPESGWIYAVNGKIMGMSSGSYIIQAGDNLIWRYTLDLGKDAGNGLEN